MLGITDTRLLMALLKTVSATLVDLFWGAICRFTNLTTLHDGSYLLTWAVYFPQPSQDETTVAVCIFTVISSRVGLSDPTPDCPRCASGTVFLRMLLTYLTGVTVVAVAGSYYQSGGHETTCKEDPAVQGK